MKNIFFLSVKDCLHNNLLILINNVLCNSKALNNNGNKWFLLDVNKKNKVSRRIKNSKGPNIKKEKMSSKKILSDVVIKLLIFLVLKIFND